MKKKYVYLSIVFLITIVFFACTLSNETHEPIVFKITYNLNGGTNPESNPASYKEGTTVTLLEPEKEGYLFDGWYDNKSFTGNKITAVSARSVELWAKWKPRSDTPYKILHYQENVNDDNYTLFETENKQGITDSKTSAVSKKYEHFVAGSVKQEVIKADGSTEVKIYYKWETVTIKLELNGGSLEGQTGVVTKTAKYGQVLKLDNPKKYGAVFMGWKTANGKEISELIKNETYYAEWKSFFELSVIVSDIEVKETQNGNIITFIAEDCDSYKWTLDNSVICTEKTCNIDSSNLKNGVYPLCLEAKKRNFVYSYFAQIVIK